MHPSISRLALRVLSLPMLSLPILCASLLACAGPDDRGPSSPVAGAHRPGELILPFEPGGGMRRLDAQVATRIRVANHVDGAFAGFDASAAFPRSAASGCGADADAPHGRQRNADALRFEPIAGECRVRIDATAGRAWTHAR